MGKKWTQKEDEFLLFYHSAIDADYIASHDLGRPHGAGSKRLKKLTKSGARLAFAQMKFHEIEFNMLAGREPIGSEDTEDQLRRWENEMDTCILLMSKGD